MKNQKKEGLRFLVWMRNGTAFCTTWFLVLMLVYSYVSDRQTIMVQSLAKMILFAIGGVFFVQFVFYGAFCEKVEFY